MLERLSQASRNGCRRYSLYRCHCGIEKLIRDDAVKNGGQNSCGCARGANLKTHGRSDSLEANMVDRSKSRAKRKGFEHSITIHDIQIPDICPLLGIPLFPSTTGRVGPNSPTLDRIDSSKGYTPDNVWVISYKANTIKSNATPEELLKIARRLADFVENRFQDLHTSNLESTKPTLTD
jgi:hypothetical protein